jgi:hypothetical protein
MANFAIDDEPGQLEKCANALEPGECIERARDAPPPTRRLRN